MSPFSLTNENFSTPSLPRSPCIEFHHTYNSQLLLTSMIQQFMIRESILPPPKERTWGLKMIGELAS